MEIAHLNYLFVFFCTLTSCNIMSLKFTHGAACVRISFVFKAESHSIVWMDHILFTCSCISAYLGCFGILFLKRLTPLYPCSEIRPTSLTSWWGCATLPGFLTSLHLGASPSFLQVPTGCWPGKLFPPPYLGNSLGRRLLPPCHYLQSPIRMNEEGRSASLWAPSWFLLAPHLSLYIWFCV